MPNLNIPGIKPVDLHLIFNDDLNRLTVWSGDGRELFRCEARNAAVGGDGFGHNARCPRGRFTLGRPLKKGTVPFGDFFTPLYDTTSRGAMREFRRAGIGIHGGGSGLAHPFVDRQGWAKTHGCIRTQNIDNRALVVLFKAAQKKGGRCYIDVIGS